jgi:hypothetical protein
MPGAGVETFYALCGNKNMGLWAGKNKKNGWVGWFHPVKWLKLI